MQWQVTSPMLYFGFFFRHVYNFIAETHTAYEEILSSSLEKKAGILD